jgi:hypothetical protein
LCQAALQNASGTYWKESTVAKSPKAVRKGAKFHEVPFDEMSDYLRILDQNEAYLKSFPGVEDVDIGYRWEGGELSDEIAIRVHVLQKVAELDPHDRVPKRLVGMKVDVVESHPALHPVRPSDLRKEVRPVRAGLEIANAHSDASGTLGAIVFDRDDGSPLALSNHHVLMSGSVDAMGERISQPGSHLGRHEIGRIVRTSPYYDAAVATLSEGVAHSTEVPEMPGGIKGVARPSLGMNVVKIGATTGLTRGMIESVSLEGFTVIPVPRQKWTEISSPGDSGAVWIDVASHAAIGLHFAGENSDAKRDERAWAMRADIVSDELDIDFCKVACLPEYPRFTPSLAAKGDDLLVAWVVSHQSDVPVRPRDVDALCDLHGTERRRSRGRDYDTERQRSRGRNYDTERLRSRGRNYDTERKRSRGRDYDTERARSRGRDYDTERRRSRGRDYDTERKRSRGRDYDTERARSRGRNYDTERIRSRGRNYDTEANRAGGVTDWGTVWFSDGAKEGHQRVEHRWVNVRVLNGEERVGKVTTLNVKSVGELALATFKDKYVLAWTAPTGEIRLRSSTDGVTWSDAIVVPETMSEHAPSLAVFQGVLYLAWHGEDKRVWLAQADRLSKWSEPEQVDQELVGGPVLASSEDRLFLAGRSKRTNRIWVRARSGAQRFGKAKVTDAKAGDRPGACVHAGRLLVGYLRLDDQRVCVQSSRTGGTWDDGVALNEWGRTSPAMCSCQAQLVYAWVDEWSGRLTLLGYDQEE